jgi:hypothetical protein
MRSIPILLRGGVGGEQQGAEEITSASAMQTPLDPRAPAAATECNSPRAEAINPRKLERFPCKSFPSYCEGVWGKSTFPHVPPLGGQEGGQTIAIKSAGMLPVSTCRASIRTAHRAVPTRHAIRQNVLEQASHRWGDKRGIQEMTIRSICASPSSSRARIHPIGIYLVRKQ